MSNIIEIMKNGGFFMYPLFFCGILSIALIIDKILLHKRLAKIPKNLFNQIESEEFSWKKIEQELQKIISENFYKNFINLLFQNKLKPIWWIESRANDEAKIIEKSISSGMWILETIVTVAPLLGLLGTIFGMMDSFKLIGDDSLINPTGVTAGVAESLIATAFGLIVAVISLFAYNYFSRKQDQILDDLERLVTKIVDQIKLESGEK